MNSQLASRISAEARGARTMVQLLLVVSFWRTAATRVMPLCGVSGWWTALLCMLPGFGVALLLRWAMAKSGSTTVTETVRACLGRGGAAVFSALLALLLLTEAVSALTALLSVFTQGVGTRGTQFTLAVLTAGVMLFSLHREGLPRAVYLLRWVMLAAALMAMVFVLGGTKLDCLFPLHGEGAGSALAGFLAAPSLAWPAMLLLTLPPCEKRGRISCAVDPSAAAIGVLFITALAVPHERLIHCASQAEALLLPVWFAPNAIRVLWLCILMLTFFLAVAACVQLVAKQLSAPFGRTPGWLAPVLLAGMTLTQAADPQHLTGVLSAAEPWLLLPLLTTALIVLLIAFIRRKNT